MMTVMTVVMIVMTVDIMMVIAAITEVVTTAMTTVYTVVGTNIVNLYINLKGTLVVLFILGRKPYRKNDIHWLLYIVLFRYNVFREYRMRSLQDTKFSILELAPIRDDKTIEFSLRHALELAQHAEKLGYDRFGLQNIIIWMELRVRQQLFYLVLSRLIPSAFV